MNKRQGQVKIEPQKQENKAQTEKSSDEILANGDSGIETSSTELTAGIIRIITEELHRRVGIGAIWRQLSPTRRQEITEKWSADIEKYLTGHK